MKIEWRGSPINFKEFCREQRKLNKLVTGEQNQTRYAVLLDPDLADEFNPTKTHKGRVPLVLLTQSMEDNALGILLLDEDLRLVDETDSGERLVFTIQEQRKLRQNLGSLLTRQRLLTMHPEFALARAIATEDSALCKVLIRDRPDLLTISNELMWLFGDYEKRLPQAVVHHFQEAGVELHHLMGLLEKGYESDGTPLPRGIRIIDANILMRRGVFRLMTGRSNIDVEVRDILPDILRSSTEGDFFWELLRAKKYELVEDLLKEGWISCGELDSGLIFGSGHKSLITEAALKGISLDPSGFLEAPQEIIEWAVDSRWGRAFGLESELGEYCFELEHEGMGCGGNVLAWAASRAQDEARLLELLRTCSRIQGDTAFPPFSEESDQVRLLGIKKQVIEKLVGVIGEAAYLRMLGREWKAVDVLMGCEALHVAMLSQSVSDENQREIKYSLVKDLGFCFIHQPAEVRDDLSQQVSQMMPDDPGAIYREMLRSIYHAWGEPVLSRQENEVLLKYIDHCPEDGKKVQRLSGVLGNLGGMKMYQLIQWLDDGYLYEDSKLMEYFLVRQKLDDVLELGQFLQEHEPLVFSALLPMLFSEGQISFRARTHFLWVLTLVKAEEELSALLTEMDGRKATLGYSFEDEFSAIKEGGCELIFKRAIQNYRKENGGVAEGSALSKFEERLGEAVPVAESGSRFGCG